MYYAKSVPPIIIAKNAIIGTTLLAMVTLDNVTGVVCGRSIYPVVDAGRGMPCGDLDPR